MDANNLLNFYRPNVGIVLFNKMGKIWLGQRFDPKVKDPEAKKWQMPQGGIDDGEDVTVAAFRELQEETGVTSARLVMMTPGWLAYDFPAGYKKKNWKGQKQKWAIMCFEGSDSEIDLKADDHQEFEDWKWAELEDAPALIVPFKRHVYDELVASLVPFRDFLRHDATQ